MLSRGLSSVYSDLSLFGHSCTSICGCFKPFVTHQSDAVIGFSRSFVDSFRACSAASPKLCGYYSCAFREIDTGTTRILAKLPRCVCCQLRICISLHACTWLASGWDHLVPLQAYTLRNYLVPIIRIIATVAKRYCYIVLYSLTDFILSCLQIPASAAFVTYLLWTRPEAAFSMGVG